MTDREKVIKGLECCVLFKGFECTNRNCPYWKDCSAVSTSNELLHDVLAMLKDQEPMVMTLEEVKHLTYGSPYIIETNLPKEEPRLMYGLFSHLGLQGIFSFAFTNGRGYLFAVDYGKRWRCWTSRPTDAQREATPWESVK